MSCTSCRLAGQCSQQGDPGVNPLDMTPKQLVTLACTLARVGSVICDLGGVGGASATPDASQEPYIWDIEED